MKMLLIFGLVSTFAVTMEPHATRMRPHGCCPNSFGVVQGNGPKTKQEGMQLALRAFACEHDSFTQYLCSQEQTVHLDDCELAITIQKDLFKRMLVHVYLVNASGMSSATEIIGKILQKYIDPHAQQVAITKKDWYYRLLAYIPFNGVMDHGCLPVLIKNKVFFLKIKSCIHTQTDIQPCYDNAHRRALTPVTDSNQIAREFSKLIELKN